MKAVITALRPRQWTKNLLVFGGLIFSGSFVDPNSVKIVLITFVCFCLLSSAGYLFNDVQDAEADKRHPEKKHRPIPSGNLHISYAIFVAILAAASSFLISYFYKVPFGAELLAIYAANQLFYMLAARKVAILDVFVISIGFLIRAIAGAAVLNVLISPWLLLCTFLLALFLGFAKRKHEFDLGFETRQSLNGYSAPLLNQLLSATAAAAIIAYCVYAIESQTAKTHPKLLWTIPFPVFGIFRYLQIVYGNNGGGSPDRELINDPWLAGTVLLWIIVSIYAMTQGVAP